MGAGLRHNIKSSGRDTILDGIGDIPSAVDIIVGIIGFTSSAMLGSIQHSYFGSAGEVQIESQSGLGDTVLFSFGVGGIAQTGCRSGIIIIVLRARSSRNIDLEMAVSDLQQFDLGDDLEVAGQSLGSRIITRFLSALFSRVASQMPLPGFRVSPVLPTGRFGLEQPVSMPEPAMATAVRAVYFIKSRRENV